MEMQQRPSGLIVVSDDKPQPSVDKPCDIYARRHCRCPKCGSSDVWKTTVGYVFTDLETYQNRNEASCACGWKGLVHDMVAHDALTEGEVWALVERLQGEVAAEIRVMLGEAPVAEENLGPEQQARRIKAMQLCASTGTGDRERHDSWMQMHLEAGWVYGAVYDAKLKIHPNLAPWDELPTATRSKARIFDIMSRFAQRLVKRLEPE